LVICNRRKKKYCTVNPVTSFLPGRNGRENHEDFLKSSWF
jgi:hypothetical protein